MTKYRIVEKRQKSGEYEYYLQKRWMFIWSYLTERQDITMYNYKIYYDTYERAVQRIEDEIKWEEQDSNKKIVSRKIINYER